MKLRKLFYMTRFTDWRSPWVAIHLLAFLTLSIITPQTLAQRAEVLEMLPPIGDSDGATTADEIIPPGGVTDPGLPPAGAEIIEPSVGEVPPSGWLATDWLTGPVWEYGAELGINGSEGNAQAFSILAGANAKRETEGNVFQWTLKYGKTQTGGVETQHFALLNSQWDWKINAESFLYNKNTFEYDEFKAFDIRLVLSGGWGSISSRIKSPHSPGGSVPVCREKSEARMTRGYPKLT